MLQRFENYDSLSKGEKKMVDKETEAETLRKWYETQLYLLAPRRWAVLKLSAITRRLLLLASKVWENRHLFFVRDALVVLVDEWDDIFPGVPCPIEFSDEEIELHSKKTRNVEIVGKVLRSFRCGSMLPVGGSFLTRFGRFRSLMISCWCWSFKFKLR